MIVSIFVHIVTSESIEAVRKGDLQRYKIRSIYRNKMCTPHDGVNVDDSAKMTSVIAEIRFNDPHSGVFIGCITDIRIPLNEDTRVPCAFKIKAHE